ncbi:MAG: glutamate--cysteine ligase, partial [Bacteroidota bacterium]
VNSRGAIPRFDRGSIEIRVMDIQECPAADMAIITLVIETIKALAGGKFIGVEDQMKWKTETLVSILDLVIENGQHAVIHQPDYIKLFGSAELTSSANAL